MTTRTREGTYNASQRSRSLNNVYAVTRSASPTESRQYQYSNGTLNRTYESIQSEPIDYSSTPSRYSKYSKAPTPVKSRNPRVVKSRATSPTENERLRFSRHNNASKSAPKEATRSRQQNARQNNKLQKGAGRSLSMNDVRKQSPTPSKSRSKSRISTNTTSSSSTPGSSEQSQVKEIILKKISSDGDWYEEREEILYVYKKDGTVFKRGRKNVSELNQLDGDELMESLATYDQKGVGNYDLERSSQLYSRHGRGLIQDNQQKFNKEILTQINAYRVQHMVKLVKLNENLNYYAREWGKYLAHVGESSFTNRHDIGESIFVKILSQPFAPIAGDDIIDKWYSEISNHDYSHPSEIQAPNFTQMIWKSTREIGVGIERSLDGKISYVVVLYYPKGNFPNEQDRQVPPVGGFSSKERNEKGFIKPHLSEKDEDFTSGVMRAVNFYRLQHSAIPFQLDAALSDYAQEWAEQLAKEDRIRSRPRNVFGENIYCSTLQSDLEIPGQEPIEYWYKKKKFHNFTEPGDIRAASFTQLVWQDSRDLGVGVAKSKTDKVYVVANFNPPGNLVGSFQNQVVPMKWK